MPKRMSIMTVLALVLITTTAYAQQIAPPNGGPSTGGGGSAFTGSTCPAPMFSATPTFSFADISVKSPTCFEPTVMSANVTAVSFSNPSAGARTSIKWLQAASGTKFSVTYGGTITNVCQVSQNYGYWTEQFIKIGADGATPIGDGCSTNDPADAPVYSLSGDVTTPGSGSGVTTIGAAKVAPAMMKAGTYDAQTDGATITWVIGSVLNATATVTLGGNRTLAITGLVINGNYMLLVNQGTGSHTLTLGSGCNWKVLGGGAGAITLSTAASAVDILTFSYDGTNCYASLGKNYN